MAQTLVQSPDEIRERESKLQALLGTVQTLHERRTELLQQLSNINQTLSSTWASYGELHNASSPINRIPYELLCLIFSYCLMVFEPCMGNRFVHETSDAVPEVIISHVCQYWRKTALGFPRLWSTFKYKTPKWRRDPIERFNGYMARSSPLSVHLYIYFKGLPHEDASLLEAAAKHIHRWKGATIICEDNTLKWSKLQVLLKNTKAPNLEYISFRPSLIVNAHTSSGNILPVQSTLEPKVFTLGAPKLKHVRLDATVPYFFLPPLTSITTFCLDAKYFGPASVTWSAFLGIIALPSLQNLSIGGHVLLPPEDEQLMQPLVSRSLKHLRWANDGERLGHLFSYLSAPNLQTLILCGMILPPTPTRPGAAVSLPSLRSLHVIECGRQIPSHFIRFLASGSPNLHDLSMSYYRPREGHLLDYLNQETQAGITHWPTLKTVTCHLQGVNEVGPYLEFIRARKRDDHPLTLRVCKYLHQTWSAVPSEAFATLSGLCTVGPWAAMSDILPRQWPPDSLYGPLSSERSCQFDFAVDWNQF